MQQSTGGKIKLVRYEDKVLIANILYGTLQVDSVITATSSGCIRYKFLSKPKTPTGKFVKNNDLMKGG